ncbi:MAG: lycopene cyclase family protein [Bacteroidota bacterium]
MRDHYQYIIVGAGCAGLQLATALLKESSLSLHSLLIIEAAVEHEEKTWCFWYAEKHPYQHLVKKRWQQIAFQANGTSVQSELPDMCYQYISSTDFYHEQMAMLRQDSRVDFLFESVSSLAINQGIRQVTTQSGTLSADYIFHSNDLRQPPPRPTLWQHFLGWEITTETDVFDTSTATLMDFSHADAAKEVFFHYVLPYSSRHALVECTFFSAELFDQATYEQLLRNYIEEKWTGRYQIVAREVGKIPMSLPAPPFFPADSGIIPIGTAAGCIKASTGYSFTRVMRHTQQILAFLKKEIPALPPPSAKRFLFYDRLFLSLIQRYPQQLPGIFASLFKRNNIQRILSFLDESTSLQEEVIIFSRLPKLHFLSVLFNPKS